LHEWRKLPPRRFCDLRASQELGWGVYPPLSPRRTEVRVARRPSGRELRRGLLLGRVCPQPAKSAEWCWMIHRASTATRAFESAVRRSWRISPGRGPPHWRSGGPNAPIRLTPGKHAESKGCAPPRMYAQIESGKRITSRGSPISTSNETSFPVSSAHL